MKIKIREIYETIQNINSETEIPNFYGIKILEKIRYVILYTD